MLPKEKRAQIEQEARRRGADPAAAVARAERRSSPTAEPEKAAEKPAPGAPSKPVADRLLIGFLPFIKVKELRQHWLGLSERIPDDELTCGEFAIKHGGAASGGGDE